MGGKARNSSPMINMPMSHLIFLTKLRESILHFANGISVYLLIEKVFRCVLHFHNKHIKSKGHLFAFRVSRFASFYFQADLRSFLISGFSPLYFQA